MVWLKLHTKRLTCKPIDVENVFRLDLLVLCMFYEYSNEYGWLVFKRHDLEFKIA